MDASRAKYRVEDMKEKGNREGVEVTMKRGLEGGVRGGLEGKQRSGRKRSGARIEITNCKSRKENMA